MYAKCGDIGSASQSFTEISERDLLTWSIMIWGWTFHGSLENALECFEQMKSTGIKPDGAVFLAMLAAFSHSGQVDSGLELFNSMQHEYFIKPTLKHYTLVVDLYGRAGKLDPALRFLESMPISPDFMVWGALFCACRARKNIQMAELVSKKLVELEHKHPGKYIFLSNVYACVGRWKNVDRVRAHMQNLKIEKDPGWSYIEVNGQIHSFVAGDRAHENVEEIYSKLEEIVSGAKEHGYMPETESVLHNIEEEEKEEHLGSHSEKWALAFGLIRTPPGMLIRIMKNLRICSDSRSIVKHASKVSKREIMVTDSQGEKTGGKHFKKILILLRARDAPSRGTNTLARQCKNFRYQLVSADSAHEELVLVLFACSKSCLCNWEMNGSILY
ncbi:hypothetical protein CDL15_Pgr026409 [Punica granatum]|uniref:DYW domain-containing protein n=1 Tax=Punica granatum TaxID=22663 RepID=A0A218XNG0_PUNGR|nr:hypothetical protein CDL15_Pgr026409 [Punica granatum]